MITQTSQVLYDGQRNHVMQFTGVSDGSGNLAQAVLFDPALTIPKCSRVSVRGITADVDFGLVELWWDAEIPVKFAELSGPDNHFSYESIGGITNNVTGRGATGKILISTGSFSNGSTYMIKLDMVKKYA